MRQNANSYYHPYFRQVASIRFDKWRMAGRGKPIRLESGLIFREPGKVTATVILGIGAPVSLRAQFRRILLLIGDQSAGEAERQGAACLPPAGARRARRVTGPACYWPGVEGSGLRSELTRPGYSTNG